MPRLALGTAVIASSNSCPVTSVPTSNCLLATVSTPGNPDIGCTLKISDPTTTLVGVWVTFVGGGGNNYWESAYANSIANFITPLRNAGFRVVQARWDLNGTTNPGILGGTQGPALVIAPRAATLIQAIKNNTSIVPTGIPLGVVGNSGGSSQIAYTLARCGGTDFIDKAVMLSGPPHGRLDLGAIPMAPGLDNFTAHTTVQSTYWQGILRALRTTQGGGVIHWYDNNISGQFIDASWLGEIRSGPVSLSSNGGPISFRKECVWSLDAELIYPTTDIRFFYAIGDGSEAVPLGRIYANEVVKANPTATITILSAATGHNIPDTANATDIATLLAELTVLTLKH